jgi:hypothetical protein
MCRAHDARKPSEFPKWVSAAQRKDACRTASEGAGRGLALRSWPSARPDAGSITLHDIAAHLLVDDVGTPAPCNAMPTGYFVSKSSTASWEANSTGTWSVGVVPSMTVSMSRSFSSDVSI